MLDKLIIGFDRVLKTFSSDTVLNRPRPDQNINDVPLSEAERKKIISLMRINYCGEICAQALYQGQALVSQNVENKNLLEKSALEETDHLYWVASRISELGGKPSILNPVFYLGSLVLGISAGLRGDKWSLGFLKETEIQVENHLNKHLVELPEHDLKSRAILQQMKIEEAAHAKIAAESGAKELPAIVKSLMNYSSKLMTFTVAWI